MRFIGNIEAKIDVKGRVFVPATFRKQLQANPEESIVMRKDIHENCLTLYPLNVWEKTIGELESRLNKWNKNHQQVLRQFVSDVEILSLDASGRMLIPKRYLALAEINTEVKFIGVSDRIEIWAKEKTEEPFIAPEEFGQSLEALMEGNNNIQFFS